MRRLLQLFAAATASTCLLLVPTTQASAQTYEVYGGEWNGSAWSVQANIDPPGYQTDAISCTSPTWCMAVDAGGYAFAWDGTGWTAPQLADPYQNSLDYVSCTSPTFCMAADDNGSVVEWNGAKWLRPVYVDPLYGGGAVSCATTSFCVMVDGQGYAFTWNGASWSTPLWTSAGWVNMPHQIDSTGNPTAVSCTSSTSCVVYDNAGDVVLWDGTSWSAPTPQSSTDVLPTNCLTRNFCFSWSSSTMATSTLSGTATTDIGPDNNDGFITTADCVSTTWCIEAQGAYGAETGISTPPLPIAVTPSVAPSTTDVGSAVTYSAYGFEPGDISLAPPATATFMVGGTVLCSGQFSSGYASCTASNAPAGSDEITVAVTGITFPAYESTIGTTSLMVAAPATVTTTTTTVPPTTTTTAPPPPTTTTVPPASPTTTTTVPPTTTTTAPTTTTTAPTSTTVPPTTAPPTTTTTTPATTTTTPAPPPATPLPSRPITPPAPPSSPTTVPVAQSGARLGISVTAPRLVAPGSQVDVTATPAPLPVTIASPLQLGVTSTGRIRHAEGSHWSCTVRDGAQCGWAGPLPLEAGTTLPAVHVTVTAGASGVVVDHATLVASALRPARAQAQTDVRGAACTGAHFKGSVPGVLGREHRKLHAPVVGITPASDGCGYRLVGSDGGVFSFGGAAGAHFHGSVPSVLGAKKLDAPVAGTVVPAGSGGYVLVAKDGGVFAFGSAKFKGSVPGVLAKLRKHLNAPVVTGSNDYRLTAKDGGVFSFGPAKFRGSVPGVLAKLRQRLAAPVVGTVMPAPNGKGYWLYAQDGGVFTFGKAQFLGSVPKVLNREHKRLAAPIVAAAALPNGKGYWLFGADGGVFTFGQAHYYGSVPGVLALEHRHLNAPIVGGVATLDGKGYWLFASDGGVFAFGAARFDGSVPGVLRHLNAPIVAGAPAPGGGYWLVASDGGVFTFRPSYDQEGGRK